MTKLGLIVPTSNTVNEAEWKRMAPSNVTFEVARMPLHTEIEGLHEDLRKAMASVSGCDVMVYACTAGSMALPLDSLTSFMQEVSGKPAVATAPALVHACRALGLTRIALATPYHDALNEHEVSFFSDNGIRALHVRGLGIGTGGPHEYVQIARVPKDKVYEHCRDADVPEAQGLIISCTDFAALEAVPRLEAELGKPVISSNLATFWSALRTAGLREPIAGFGRLLGKH